jgi:hypothetical protein
LLLQELDAVMVLSFGSKVANGALDHYMITVVDQVRFYFLCSFFAQRTLSAVEVL